MALAKPVICSRLAGTPEQVIDGVTGILVEPANTAELSDAIFELATEPDKVSKMGLAARLRYKSNFAPSVVIDRYTHFYQRLFEK